LALAGLLLLATDGLAGLAQTPAPPAQAPAAQAPPTSWSQFRGSPRLTGVSAATLPPTLKVLWTYETGDAIDSSAAIADGSV